MGLIMTVVLVALLAFFVFFFLKMEHHGRKIKVVLLVLLGLLLYFSIMGILSSEKVDMTSPRGVVNAVYVYFGWIGNTISNLWDVGVETTGNVVKAVKINETSEK